MTGQNPWAVPQHNWTAEPKTSVPQLVGYWAVVLAWMGVISLMSSEPFSASNTHRYIDPILRFFFPAMRPADFVFAHTVIRKTAHFTEFFVLGSLLFWALRHGRGPRWRAGWMLQALLIALAYSLGDELHQAWVPNRTPSLADSGVDSLGAGASQALIYLRYVRLSRFGLLR